MQHDYIAMSNTTAIYYIEIQCNEVQYHTIQYNMLSTWDILLL